MQEEKQKATPPDKFRNNPQPFGIGTNLVLQPNPECRYASGRDEMQLQ
jgi:hypothetical protein